MINVNINLVIILFFSRFNAVSFINFNKDGIFHRETIETMIYVVCVFFLHLIIFYIMIYTKSHDVQKLRLNQMNGVLVLLNVSYRNFLSIYLNIKYKIIFYLAPRHDSDGAISLNEEDIAIIMKGNYKERENYRSDTLDDEEVHFERTKRKYVDSNNDDISSKKHKNSPSTFCSYV